jgi:hypothetical protein
MNSLALTFVPVGQKPKHALEGEEHQMSQKP